MEEVDLRKTIFEAAFIGSGVFVKLVVDTLFLDDDNGFPPNILEHYRGKPMVLDFMPDKPMETVIDHYQVETSLMFGSGVFRCRIPWGAIVTIQLPFRPSRASKELPEQPGGLRLVE